MNAGRKYKAALIPGLLTLIFTWAGSLGIAIAGNNPDNEPETSSKDTIPAIVMYGEHFLFEHLDHLTECEILEYRDSLSSMVYAPENVIRQIDVYLDMQRRTDAEVYLLIDSLFEAESVPYPLVNQINLFLATRPKWDEPEEFFDTSFYPANQYYHDWNTQNPNPYNSRELIQGDSIVYLKISGSTQLQDFVPPIPFKKGKLTSKYGWREGKNHNGIDIDLEVWDSVVTAFPGKVRVARTFGGYGRVVVVRHYNGLESYYAHLHRIKVKPGQTLKAGELVGLGGSSGNSTGSHLHFEIRFKGVPINPLTFISYKESQLVNDTIVLKRTKWGYAAYPKGTIFHVVEKGDFLYKIAEQYGTSTGRICEMNGIRKNTRLRVGQRLRVI